MRATPGYPYPPLPRSTRRCSVAYNELSCPPHETHDNIIQFTSNSSVESTQAQLTPRQHLLGSTIAVGPAQPLHNPRDLSFDLAVALAGQAKGSSQRSPKPPSRAKGKPKHERGEIEGGQGKRETGAVEDAGAGNLLLIHNVAYSFIGPAAALIQGVELGELPHVEVVVQWDQFRDLHASMAPAPWLAGPINVLPGGKSSYQCLRPTPCSGDQGTVAGHTGSQVSTSSSGDQGTAAGHTVSQVSTSSATDPASTNRAPPVLTISCTRASVVAADPHRIQVEWPTTVWIQSLYSVRRQAVMDSETTGQPVSPLYTHVSNHLQRLQEHMMRCNNKTWRGDDVFSAWVSY
eukprot:gene17902-24294_t